MMSVIAADPPAQSHIHPGHEGEVKCHVALIPIAVINAYIVRPLVGLRQDGPGGILLIDLRTNALHHCVGFGEIFAVGSFPLHQVGKGATSPSTPM